MTAGSTGGRPGATDGPTTAVAVIGGLGSAAVVVVAALRGSEAELSGFVVLVALWALSPFVGLWAAAQLARRRFPRGRLVLLLAGLVAVVMSVISAVALATSESSTAPLLLLWMPLYQWLVVLVGVAIAVVVHRSRS